MSDVNISFWSWSIIVFESFKKFENVIFGHFFRTRKSKKSIFCYQPPRPRFLGNRETRKSARRGRVRCGNHPKPVFLEFRRSLRSKWVIYQPHTTIFDEVLWSRCWSMSGRFPGNRILVDLWMWDTGSFCSQKPNIIKTSLGWFSHLTRPHRADLQFFRKFWSVSGPRKPIFNFKCVWFSRNYDT